MAIPSVSLTILDGALGIVDATGRVSAKIGASSSGTANTVYSFSDIATVKATLGTGPLPEAIAHTLAVGGGTVLAVKGATSTAGANGSVTKVGTGLCVVSVSGTPVDAYEVVVTIAAGGTNPAAGTATFTYSVDGGDTVSAITAVPTGGSFVLLDTGLTLAFSAASLVAGDTYSFTTTAPAMTGSDITTALAALTADPRVWKFVHILGSASTAAGQASIAATVETLLLAQETAYRYAYAMLEGPDLGDGTAGDSGLMTAFASFAALRTAVCVGFEDLTSVLTGRVHKRSCGWVQAARRHVAPIYEDSARVESGPLPGIVKLWRDENTNPALDAAKFSTLRTHIGLAGFYATNCRIFSATGSDFVYAQHREIMDVACAIVRAGLLKYSSGSVRTNPASSQIPSGQAGAPGTIDERDARKIEDEVNSKLGSALLANGAVSACGIDLVRTNNITSTQTLKCKVRIQPLGYLKTITADIGYTNPALTLS